MKNEIRSIKVRYEYCDSDEGLKHYDFTLIN